MGPCVTGDLMAVPNHAPNETWPWCIGIIDSAFSKVATGDVERRFSIIPL